MAALVFTVLLVMFLAFVAARSGAVPFLQNFTWRGEVRIMQAQLRSPDTLILNVSSCNADPEVVSLRETDTDVQVKVIASSWPFRGGGNDCGDIVELSLQKPLGDRVLIDEHNNQPVRVNVERNSASANTEPDDQGNLPDVLPGGINAPPNAAELQDLQRIADQNGTSLEAAIDRYGWNENFSMLVASMRNEFSDDYSSAAIGDTGTDAWIAFAGSVPEKAFAQIANFESNHVGVKIEVRTGHEFTQKEIETAVPAAHYAVYESPEVHDASTGFNIETRRITSRVELNDGVPESIVTELQLRAVRAITNELGPEIFDIIEVIVIRSNGPVGGDD
ncbi:hypothetical protein JYU04_03820 [Dehalococcoides mccartyi]|nr:hypothetical protein [Dehalococcoides mccartyi]